MSDRWLSPAGVAPRLPLLPGIKAVLFDIYGTLLTSEAGESHPDPRVRTAIENAHAASPAPFPEVDIREIHGSLNPELAFEEIEDLALRHELACNPTSEMPGAAGTLHELRRRGFTLGLISNAQFYTVPVLEKDLSAPLESLGIDRGLVVLSYHLRRAKPDPFLFETPSDQLAGRGIPPAAVLYLGNDVRNDIDPARAAGFRTALFAGDGRSLRLRGRSPEDCGSDAVLTELPQLLQIVGGGC